MGLPVRRLASARSARVVRALPTAPAERPRSLAISPTACGPGRAASHSATWRRSWPLPSRPFGPAGAGAVIGNASVGMRRRELSRRAHASLLPWIRKLRGIPRYFWVHDDAISPFRRQSTPFRFELANSFANFRAFHHSLLRPRLPSAPTPFTASPVPPFPRLPAPSAPPRTLASAWPHALTPPGGHAPPRTRQGPYPSPSDCPATDRK